MSDIQAVKQFLDRKAIAYKDYGQNGIAISAPHTIQQNEIEVLVVLGERAKWSGGGNPSELNMKPMLFLEF